jgi:ABC-type multidrug transport system ATPase subunit
MIECRDLTVRYADRAVVSVTLTVPAGQRVALLGPNGAGKTTLLRGLLAHVPVTGTAQINGYDVVRDGVRARAHVGYVPQTPAYPPHLLTGEVLAFFMELRGLAGDPLPLLDGVGLAGEARKPVGQLSGGMARRLALAVAQIGDPPVVLMDEPASYLDAGGEGLLREWFEGAAVRGTTVLVATHHLNGLSHLVDRLVLLEDGRIAADAAVAQIRATQWVELVTDPPLDPVPAPAVLLPTTNGRTHLRVPVAALGHVLQAMGRRAVQIHEPAMIDVLRAFRP